MNPMMKIDLQWLLICLLFLAGCESKFPPTKTISLTDVKSGIEFILVEPGSFFMGSPAEETGRHGDEDPVRQVKITRPYYLGKYEVTQQQWEAIMGNNPSIFYDYPESGNHPVDMISWDDAAEFISKLNAEGIGQFRMPTEAEWEYACRAGSTARFYWGDDPGYKLLNQYAWGYSRAEGRSHPVGSKEPNAWGFYDLSGGVWEWCSDWRGDYNPADTLDPQGPAEGKSRIYRGGSWFNEPEALRSANRHGHPPDTRGSNSGLRLVLEVE
jgi:formylglycine-generating enzyme required for sulfatase activity